VIEFDTRQADVSPGGTGVTHTPCHGFPGVEISVGVQVRGLEQDGVPVMTHVVVGVGLYLHFVLSCIFILKAVQ